MRNISIITDIYRKVINLLLKDSYKCTEIAYAFEKNHATILYLNKTHEGFMDFNKEYCEFHKQEYIIELVEKIYQVKKSKIDIYREEKKLQSEIDTKFISY
jgi:hypothetical protein